MPARRGKSHATQPPLHQQAEQQQAVVAKQKGNIASPAAKQGDASKPVTQAAAALQSAGLPIARKPSWHRANMQRCDAQLQPQAVSKQRADGHCPDDKAPEQKTAAAPHAQTDLFSDSTASHPAAEPAGPTPTSRCEATKKSTEWAATGGAADTSGVSPQLLRDCSHKAQEGWLSILFDWIPWTAVILDGSGNVREHQVSVRIFDKRRNNLKSHIRGCREGLRSGE